MAGETVTTESFEATLKGLCIPIGLRLEALTLSGLSTRFTNKPLELALDQPGSYKVTILESDIASFLNGHGPANLKDFVVQALPGVLVIDVMATVIIPIKARIEANLVIKDRKELIVTVQKVDVMGVGAKGLVQNQIDKINPIVTVDDLPLRGTLDNVEIRAGIVEVRGTILGS